MKEGQMESNGSGQEGQILQIERKMVGNKQKYQ